MKHFPIFLAVAGKRIVVSGGGEAAIAKLRILLKTEARISVFAKNAIADIHRLAAEGKLTLTNRAMDKGDAICAALFYGANEDAAEDARTAAIAASEGALVNIVNNLADSQFITPAIVDRDPVTIAIGTEGAAPVLARAIKADLEERLPASLGTLAKIGKTFRHAVEVLPFGAKRRNFWSDFYFNAGPSALDQQGAKAVLPALEALLDEHIMTRAKAGHVDIVGAGPGDADLITLKARKSIDRADVIIHDGDVTAEILELARREAIIIDAGSENSGAVISQDDISDLLIEHARDGLHIVRLKVGEARINPEVSALLDADIAFTLVAGLAPASQIIPFQKRNNAVHAQCTPSARLVTSQIYASEAI